ncbi:MAG: hypothetical protein BZY79_04920 [SAR202 cluster bacterium Casp-Chloro-G4]|nr:AAA family ATPase [Chloroflexota bacterium]MDA1226395.1 AAA family ATPase [Chloroflexota bacterium]PKB61224.1 MAG: hypothetical protein BZY79_04920 [SAR202 cluster bacterium Casp-Chloro-G4]
MAITKISISNFKSFQDTQEIELGKLNLLLGANASGKSNFVQLFQFLRDVATHGLEYAISVQGGVEYIKNVVVKSSANCTFKFAMDLDEFWVIPRVSFGSRPSGRRERAYNRMRIHNAECRFSIKFNQRGNGYNVVEDMVKIIYSADDSREKGRGVDQNSMKSGCDITNSPV